MDNLIEALTIFRKYGNPRCPTHCEHNEMYVMINPKLVSEEDKAKLEELYFFVGDFEDCFKSFFFGSGKTAPQASHSFADIAHSSPHESHTLTGASPSPSPETLFGGFTAVIGP